MSGVLAIDNANMKSFHFKLGIFLVSTLTLCALLAPLVSPYNPNAYALEQSFCSPNWLHWFGCDSNGRDILSRILYGAQISLGIAVTVTLISLVSGCIIGLWVGYIGGWWDRVFLFISDVLLAFPSFLFALSIAVFFKPSLLNIVWILSLKGWITFARLVRGQTLALKEREFILASKALGVGKIRLLGKHLFPNMIGPVVVNASFGLAGVILVESSLSFLGVGVPPGTPSWGAMLDEGTQYLLIAPHLSIFPGVFIMCVVLGFNFLGDGLRDRFSPRGR